MHASLAEDGSLKSLEATEPVDTEYEVPFHLDNLRKHLTNVRLARRVLPDDVAARQKLLEESVYDIATARSKHDADLFTSLGMSGPRLKDASLRAWVWEWHQKLQARIEEELASMIGRSHGSKLLVSLCYLPNFSILCLNLGAKVEATMVIPFLTLLKPEKMSLLTIMETLHLSGSGGLRDGMKTARALLAIGNAVEREYKSQICKKNNISVPVPSSRASEQNFFTGRGYQNLFARRVAARRFMEDAEEWTSEWSHMMRVKVGSFLVDNLMAVATVTRTGIDKRTGKEM